jgi:hypothetical protein
VRVGGDGQSVFYEVRRPHTHQHTHTHTRTRTNAQCREPHDSRQSLHGVTHNSQITGKRRPSPSIERLTSTRRRMRSTSTPRGRWWRVQAPCTLPSLSLSLYLCDAYSTTCVQHLTRATVRRRVERIQRGDHCVWPNGRRQDVHNAGMRRTFSRSFARRRYVQRSLIVVLSLFLRVRVWIVCVGDRVRRCG